MFENKWVGLLAGLLIWMIYFYTLDLVLMEVQGLPVGGDLMPK